MIASYLDENVPPLVTKLLQAEKYDVVSAHEVGMFGKDDDERISDLRIFSHAGSRI